MKKKKKNNFRDQTKHGNFWVKSMQQLTYNVTASGPVLPGSPAFANKTQQIMNVLSII